MGVFTFSQGEWLQAHNLFLSQYDHYNVPSSIDDWDYLGDHFDKTVILRFSVFLTEIEMAPWYLVLH
jgi:hypothetical protein